MAKIEIISTREGFALEATFREPFEYFFEIALHHARFESRYDAQILREKVIAAVKDNGWKSGSFVITMEHWNYRSSAYRGRMDESCKTTKFYPISAAATRALALAD